MFMFVRFVSYNKYVICTVACKHNTSMKRLHITHYVCYGCLKDVSKTSSVFNESKATRRFYVIYVMDVRETSKKRLALLLREQRDRHLYATL